MYSVVGPTLVAMVTTFALGAESNRLPACIGDFVQVQILGIKFWALGGLNQKSKKDSFVECHMEN